MPVSTLCSQSGELCACVNAFMRASYRTMCVYVYCSARSFHSRNALQRIAEKYNGLNGSGRNKERARRITMMLSGDSVAGMAGIICIKVS